MSGPHPLPRDIDLSDDITRLLHSWRAGDLQARESLFDAVYAMLRDMDRFAREQPVAFFGLAVAAGFLAVRLLRDSSSSH